MAKLISSVHPSIEMVESWTRTLPEKTGRSLEDWMAYIRKEGPGEEAACCDWLNRRHVLGTNTAWWLAEKSLGGAAKVAEDTPEGYLKLAPLYVDQQFAGKKVALRPLYDRLLQLAFKLGRDVKACPCKTMVPLYREHVFAQLKPTTNTRLDLGLVLGPLSDAAISRAGARIIDTGGKAKKDRITHRIAIIRLEDIDAYVSRWLEHAYALDEPKPSRPKRVKPMKAR